jgi:pimeloyl-ACP methyl ester carboxylesterase
VPGGRIPAQPRNEVAQRHCAALRSVSGADSARFIRLAYTEWGPRESKQTVVCVHGLTRNSRDFDFLAQHLAQRGMRVVAPDLPGRGRSERLPRALDYATPAYLSAMAALLARLNVSDVDWIGTSLGGHIGMEFAAQRGAPIRRLVLNDFGARVQGAGLNRLGSYMRLNQQFKTIDDLEQHFRNVYRPFGALTTASGGTWRSTVPFLKAMDTIDRTTIRP